MRITKSVFGLVFMGASCIILLGGIPCWIIGSQMPDYYQSDILVSVPLFPSPDSPDLPWLGTVFSSNGTPSHNVTMTVSLTSVDSKRLSSDTVIHFVHNLFGYDIDLRMTISGHSQSFTAKRNAVIGSFDVAEPIRANSRSLPSTLSINRFFRVSCPFTTVVTKVAEIEPQCERLIGSFMELSDHYEVIDLPGKVPSNTTEITVNFVKLTAVPTNYIEEPQMFIGIWRESDTGSLIIGGGILTGAGILTSVITICLFFAYWGGG
jgi:hypothetical protein